MGFQFWLCVGGGVSQTLRCIVFFFFKQKTAYEMRISDWSSDVCSSDLQCRLGRTQHTQQRLDRARARTATPTVEIEFEIAVAARHEIGRASCRERVWPYV